MASTSQLSSNSPCYPFYTKEEQAHFYDKFKQEEISPYTLQSSIKLFHFDPEGNIHINTTLSQDDYEESLSKKKASYDNFLKILGDTDTKLDACINRNEQAEVMLALAKRGDITNEQYRHIMTLVLYRQLDK